MWSRVLLLVLLAFAPLAVSAQSLPEPANLDPHKAELRAYVKSGRYADELAAVARAAQTWVETRAAQGGARLTVVFDLDETLLSNWPHMSEMDFGYVPKTWNAWVDSATAPAIEPVREVYRAARRLGVAVVFLTGRHERDCAGTERNLRAIGCGDYTALLCRPDDAKGSTEKFKTAARAQLETDGARIIANLGDQQSDLAGGHAERIFKLPNPFYLTL